MGDVPLWRVSVDDQIRSSCKLVIHTHVVVWVANFIYSWLLTFTLNLLLKTSWEGPPLALLFFFEMLVVLAYLFHLAHFFLYRNLGMLLWWLLQSAISIRSLWSISLGLSELIVIIACCLSLRLTNSNVFLILCNLISNLAILFFISCSHYLFIHKCIVWMVWLSLLEYIAGDSSLTTWELFK